MVNINFVPDDYIQSNESRRTNLIYLVLFAAVMTALGGSFTAIKMRQRTCTENERFVSDKMAEIQEDIKQFEQLQTKRAEMMKTALTTAELLEPVPRSVLLASLTNNLPNGVSLFDVSMIQKQISSQPMQTVTTTKYQATKTSSSPSGAQSQQAENPEKLLETQIKIAGTALNDLQVAAYIEQLSNSNLLDNVALVESIEFKFEDSTFRHFKLTAMLSRDVHLSKEDVEDIRKRAANTVNTAWTF